MKTCDAEGTLVVPFWKSSVFWTILCPDGIHFNKRVHDWELLRNHNKNLIIRGKAKNGYFCTKNRELKIVLLRISFRRTPRQSDVKFCTSTEGVCSHCRKCQLTIEVKRKRNDKISLISRSLWYSNNKQYNEPSLWHSKLRLACKNWGLRLIQLFLFHSRPI